MKGLRKKRRIQLIAAAAGALVLATALIGYAMRDGISYFRSPTEVLAQPPHKDDVFRIGGLVEKGTLLRGQGEAVRFSVTDGGGSVPVRYTGVLPDIFAENQGVIVTGRLVEGTFIARQIMAKHDEKYLPREVIDALKDQGVYKSPGS